MPDPPSPSPPALSHPVTAGELLSLALRCGDHADQASLAAVLYVLAAGITVGLQPKALAAEVDGALFLVGLHLGDPAEVVALEDLRGANLLVEALAWTRAAQPLHSPDWFAGLAALAGVRVEAVAFEQVRVDRPGTAAWFASQRA